MDVSKGLIGRRVCGGVEIGFGVLCLLGATQTADIFSILSGLFIIATGVLGTASHIKGTVIAYLVCGIICVVLFLGSTILGVVAVIQNRNTEEYYNEYFTEKSILIAGTAMVAILLIVAIFGVVFACLPVCGRKGNVPYERLFSPNVVGPPPSYANSAYLSPGSTDAELP